MSRIQLITGFTTNDGKFHKTEIDAKIHVAGINAKIDHFKKQIAIAAGKQRQARQFIKDIVVKNRQHVANGGIVDQDIWVQVSSFQQYSIARGSKDINVYRRQLDALIKTLKA